ILAPVAVQSFNPFPTIRFFFIFPEYTMMDFVTATVDRSRIIRGVLLLLLLVAGMTGIAQDREPLAAGLVELASEPAGAVVCVGDSLAGRSPLRLPRHILDRVTVWYPGRTVGGAQVRPADGDALGAEAGVLLLRFDDPV